MACGASIVFCCAKLPLLSGVGILVAICRDVMNRRPYKWNLNLYLQSFATWRNKVEYLDNYEIQYIYNEKGL
jgi:hypothetical protein